MRLKMYDILVELCVPTLISLFIWGILDIWIQKNVSKNLQQKRPHLSAAYLQILLSPALVAVWQLQEELTCDIMILYDSSHQLLTNVRAEW